MADAVNAALMKNRFYEQLEHYRRSRPPKKIVSISDERYHVILEDIPQAKSREHKSDHELWLLKHYDILKINGIERLIDPSNKMIYLADGQLFDALHEAHVGIGHGGRTRMTKLLRAQYKNISRNAIELYCDICEKCQQKSFKPKPMPENMSRGQTALIDFQTNPDGEYNFLLVYQDCLTKFIVLRPLKTNCSSEVAYNLLDIFSVYGAPAVLCYYNSIDYIKQILEYFQKFKIFKIIYGDYKYSKDKEYMENIITDINLKINDWMQQSKVSHWSIGSSFIQLMKNQGYNYDILQNSYKALFGKPIKLGLAIENSNSIQTDEDLKKSLCGHDRIEIQYDPNRKKRSTSVSIDTIPSSKKSKSRKKTKYKKPATLTQLFHEFTCSDSISETVVATKTINDIYDGSDLCQNATSTSDAIMSILSVCEETSDVASSPVVNTDASLQKIISELVESEPLFDDGYPSTRSTFSVQEIRNNDSAESITDAYLSTGAPVASIPILEEFNPSVNTFTILTTTTTKETDIPFPTCPSVEQTINICNNIEPAFNDNLELGSKINCYQNSEAILKPNILQQSSINIVPCSELFQDTNLKILDSICVTTMPTIQTNFTTHSFSQSLEHTNYSLSQPLPALNINYNFPQSNISTRESTGNIFFSVPKSITNTFPSSQSLSFKDSTLALPHSNISFVPLNQSIITTTASNHPTNTHITIPQSKITYLSSTQLPISSYSNFTQPHSIISSLPVQSFSNIDFESAQLTINTLSSSNLLESTNSTLPLSNISIIPSQSVEHTNFISSQSIINASSFLQSFVDTNYNIPTPVLPTLPALQPQRYFDLPQSINMISTSQSFENCNYISSQNVVSTLPSSLSLKDANLTLPQSTITSDPLSKTFKDNDFDTSQSFNATFNSSDSMQKDISTPVVNSITSSITHHVTTNNPTDLCDNNIQNNLNYCPSSEPFIITIPSAETYEQAPPLTGSNNDTFSPNSNTATQSEPIIIPLPNFKSNFFQALPTLESNYCQ